MMRRHITLFFTLLMALSSMARATQTFIFIRHGEKPDNGSGQLTCKGLNRSLALPTVLVSRFGPPGAIFASAPDQSNTGSSLRALSTVTPLAVQLSVPINLEYHAADVKRVAKRLTRDKQPVILVAWEHHNLIRVVKSILRREGADSSVVPDSWPKYDYDSIFVLTINRETTPPVITFSQQQEGLNGVSDRCRTAFASVAPAGTVYHQRHFLLRQ
ncbi:histidine phosphatase family protein [Shimwellia blattae]|uniref:Histidine phosphatase family protein n=1 Tax=Shimwellia blattae (strain ATCC 29907 / DSM 4481 / JCM 1650 / NBRC 105725 / CDC 9005-74) TaxID=630626 RepID=I2B649_SHIBC|nr:histidine phosphatase family protein [Shimwellia blattae]AFJ46003.1 hypothetical protein EBL_c08830 [Shimwellia blattae DSM 4481 = NBRC 105725]VDY63479.1 Uncharacterised protein [Shimwellia blattae]VEC21415.1 Uncharacterised protein [Shimwellia blattae]